MKKKILLAFVLFILITASAKVIAASITVSTNYPSALSTTYGTASSTVTFSVSGTGLSASISLTSNNGFQISTSSTSGFSTSLTLPETGGTVAATTIYIRISSTAPFSYYFTGTVICSSSGATSQTVNTSGAVAAAALTITASNVSRVYGTALSTPVSGSTAFTAIGLQNGETVGSVTITYNNDYSATTPVGTYTGQVTPSSATGGSFTSSNYNITYSTGSIIVTAAALTITATAVSKSYGAALTGAAGSTAFTASGLVNGETIGSVTMAYGTGAAATAAVGTYTATATPSSATGGSGTESNYNITYVSANITVTVATLTIIASATKVYGATLTSGSTTTNFTTSGLQNGETIGSVTNTYGAAAAATASVGTYIAQATPSAATGGTFNASNYSITYTSGSITVTAATLTITSAAASNKTYNGTTAATITGTLSGIVNSDAVTLNGTGTFASASVGTGKSVTATCTLSGSAAGNYTLTEPTGLTANITPAALTITATGPQYDATQSMGTVTGATTNFTYTGIVTGETVTSVTLTPNKTGTQAAGTAYTVTPSAAVVSSSSSNYTITYVAFSGTVGYSYTWTGSANTNWNNSGNWTGGSAGGTPGTHDNVAIPNTTNLPTVNVASSCGSITINGSTTITVAAPLTVSGLLTINTYGSYGYALQISGTSSATFGGISGIGYLSSFTINSGPTVNFSANSTINNTASQKPITNNGTLNFLANCTINLNYANALVNTGTMSAISSIFNVINSSSTMSNYGTFNDNGSTFNLSTSPGYFYNLSGGTFTTTAGNPTIFNVSGSNCYISNSGTFTDNGSTFNMNASAGSFITNAAGATFYASKTNTSTFNFSGQGSILSNLGTYVDNGSTYNFTSSHTGITNGSSTVTTNSFVTKGGTFVFSAGNPESITNYSTFTASANTTMSLQTYQASITNSGIFNAGISNSPCSITLSGQSSNITNSGTFNLGSTSIIMPSGATANIANNSPGVFTLESDAYGSATIGGLYSTAGNLASVTGTYNVQRYINGGSSNLYQNGQGYRILSSPVNLTSTSGSGNVSLEYINTSQTVTNANAIVGTTNYPGAYTGGPGGSSFGANSGSTYTYQFTTKGCCGTPTLYLYNEAPQSNTKAYFTSGKTAGITAIGTSTVSVLSNGITNTGVTIPVGNAFYIYFIGPNSQSSSAYASAAPSATTTTATGYINQQTIPVTLWNTSPTAGTVTQSTYLSYQSTGTSAGWNMIGNPYPSAIDLSVLVTDNKAISSNNTYVSFAALDDYTDQFDTYNESSGISSNPNFSHYIASGQGFMVLATANGTQTLTFKEDQKVTNTTAPLNNTSSPPILLAKEIPSSALSAVNENPGQARSLNTTRSIITSPSGAVMHLKLTKDSVNTDACAIGFAKQWPDTFGTEDVIDLDGNPNIYLSSYSSDGVRTSINAMGDYTPGKRVKLYVKGTANGLYQLTLNDFVNLDTSAFNIYLVDNVNKDSLDLARYKTYNFNVTASDTSAYDNRFVLAIEKKPLPPYQLITFTGQKVTTGVQINWKTANEGDYTGFVLQKQDQSGTFNNLYTEQSNGSANYSFTDNSPIVGNNIYRLQQSDINGNITYSNLVEIIYNPSAAGSNFTVYPNPAKGIITINVNSTTTVSPNYNSIIYDSAGMLIGRRSVNSNTWTEDVSSYKAGVYIIELSGNDGNLIGKSKFVKTN